MTASYTSLCICGSSLPRTNCCVRYHAGELAPTPESLMRSRYVAYAEQQIEYLRDTWHPETRPARLDPDPETRWCRLEIISSNENDDQGVVHFRATWQAAERWGVLEEVSRFVRENGRWLYHSGDVTQHSLKPGRNDDCPCGSGKKYKKCCARS